MSTTTPPPFAASSASFTPPVHAAARPSQVWVIFRKDAQHVWLDVLVSVGLLIGFAATNTLSAEAAQVPGDGFNLYALIAGIVRFLIPISWMVLISRLVHDEELVGDRQFWITRPYAWYFLLLEKVLFIVVFLGVPFALMQAWMLHHAGLYVLYSLGAMLSSLATLAMTFILPLLAIAAVTMTFIRYISSVLAGFLYCLVVIGIASWKWGDRMQTPGADWTVTILFVLLLVAAVLIQYARRRTAVARTILLATPLAVVVAAALLPASALINHHFSRNALGAMTFVSDPQYRQPQGRLFGPHGETQIHIPVSFQLNGMPDDAYLQVAFVRAIVDGPGGLHRDGGWEASPLRLNAGSSSNEVVFRMPESFLQSMNSQPVHLQLQVAGSVWKPGTPWTVAATEKPFPLPERANCVLDAGSGSLQCHHAFRFSSAMTASATVHSGDCLTPGPATAVANGFLTPDAGVFDPVATSNVRFALANGRPVGICPGAPVTFTPYVEGTRGQLSLDIPAIVLEPYATHIPVRPQAQP